jgi:hypothetical protein
MSTERVEIVGLKRSATFKDRIPTYMVDFVQINPDSLKIEMQQHLFQFKSYKSGRIWARNSKSAGVSR